MKRFAGWIAQAWKLVMVVCTNEVVVEFIVILTEKVLNELKRGQNIQLDVAKELGE